MRFANRSTRGLPKRQYLCNHGAWPVVGINPWVVARDAEVYGEDAEDFRPDRWLTADEQQLKAMERNNLAVSVRWRPVGLRTALGREYADIFCFICSSAPAPGRVSGRTSPSWRCPSWFRRFCVDSTSSSRIQTGTGSCTTIGSSRRLGLISRSRQDTNRENMITGLAGRGHRNGRIETPQASKRKPDTEGLIDPARLHTDKNPDLWGAVS